MNKPLWRADAYSACATYLVEHPDAWNSTARLRSHEVTWRYVTRESTPESGGKWTEALGLYWERARYRTNRSALNSRLDQNVQHRGATDANLAGHVSGRASRLVQLHHALADTLGRATVRDDGPASESSGRRTKFNGGVGGVLSQGHHKRLTRNITQMNVGAALREILLEGVLVAG